MYIDREQLQPYLDNKADLIPIHAWNKQKAGKNIGKNPVDNDWVNKQYTAEQLEHRIEQGFNMGYRISPTEVVIDIDPRNYDEGIDSEEKLAELFGAFDFDDLLHNIPSVRTGGGGYHLYCKIPDTVHYQTLKETVGDVPGVEFKHYGRQVLCAGSKHPSGKYYEWVNQGEPAPLPEKVLALLHREIKQKEYSSGAGALTGGQLMELVLSKLPVEEYDTNGKWWPMLCGAHHATAGEGIEEFLQWSLSDGFYENDENVIRARWDSLWEKDNSITVGTLIEELKKHGEDTTGVKTVLDFGSVLTIDEEDEEDLNEDDLKLREISKVAEDIDLSDVYSTPEEFDAQEEGTALRFAEKLTPGSNNEDIIKAIRLCKASDVIECSRALARIQTNTKIPKTVLNKIMKEIEKQISDDLARVLAEKTLRNVFNNGRHLLLTPTDILYVYNGRYWERMSESFLGKIMTRVFDSLKKKVDVKVNENNLITQALAIAKRLSASSKDRLHSQAIPKAIINCKNGELHLNKDGTHVLKPHNYRSYLLQCLDVDYSPGAVCPLFDRTISEIFGHYRDREDLVRHIGELFGYTIQPYKNIASWWLFRGPGGDGKSTLLHILGGILGNSQRRSTSKILGMGDENGGGSNHTSTGLVGALNIAIEELPSGYLLKDSGLKLLSELTKMEADPKHKDSFQFTYCANLIMCSNGWPATRDLSHGMMRRANIVPFNRQFTESEKGEDLDRGRNILDNPDEMAGVLNFCLEGLKRLRSRGKFLPPVSCEEAKKIWMGESNPVVRFVEEKITKTKNVADRVIFKEVNLQYHQWCIEADSKPKGRNTFKNDLINLGFDLRKGAKNVYYLYGCKLNINDFDGVIDGSDDDW